MPRISLPQKVHRYAPLRSVVFALAGIRSGFKTEKNLSLQCAIGITLIAVSLKSAQLPMAVVHLLCMAMVMSLELINTSFEFLCDLVHPSRSDLVRSIKDIAAGAVLLMALAWLVIIAAHLYQLLLA